MKIKHIGSLSFVVLWAWLSVAVAADQVPLNALAVVDQQIAAHSSQSGIYVLDKGEEALIARAWLADHAQKTIEVQYFIWSTDKPDQLSSVGKRRRVIALQLTPIKPLL